MAANAAYINVNPANREEKWADFAPYLPLISVLWLAAKDEAIPACDGHTLEGRREAFFTELALIGRAHNYDKTRINSRGADEEYDDLMGDKPSCYSGVKRRLFQSVIGHPMLVILTTSIVDQEIRDFVRDIYGQRVTEENKHLLRSFWDEYITELEISTEGEAAFLKLNISVEEQTQFIDRLREKFPDQCDATIEEHIKGTFAINPEGSRPADRLHAFKLDGLVSFEQMLPKRTAANPTSPTSPGTFFSQKRTSSHDPEDKLDPGLSSK